MTKQFLVTISNDVQNLFGVKFICSFFDKMSENRVTLLHICKRDASNMTTTLMGSWSAGPDGTIIGQPPAGARKTISKAKSIFSEAKVPIDAIITKTVVERFGKVKDILTEGSNGMYDAIILGRRASYALQWMFEKSADETILKMLRDTCCSSPLWICPDTDLERKNVLLCIDGSDNSYRAADHVGYILSDQKQHSITLYHVDGGNSANPEGVLDKANTFLSEHGIESQRIYKCIVKSRSVAKSIFAQIEKGRYAAVAMGFRGDRQGANIAGSTTLNIMKKTDKVSLWCCP